MNKYILLLSVCVFINTTVLKSQGTTCATATSLTVNGACGSGTITNAVATVVAPPCNMGSYTVNREGWYKFTATSTHATITGISSAGGLCVQVFSLSGACPAGLTTIGCGDAVIGITAQTESCGFTSGLTAGTTYYIRVIGYQNANVVLTSLCVTDALNSYAIPTCVSNDIAAINGNVINVYDPTLPVSGTNPTHTIPFPYSTYDGLTLSPNLNGGVTSPTYYTTFNGNFMWWNATTLAWVNTGHTNGTAFAVNLTAGGGYIYALEAATGNVYRYNGTGNATLFSIPTLTAGTVAVADLIADSSGNLYVVTYNSGTGAYSISAFSAINGSLLCSVPVTFPLAPGGGAGLSINGSNVSVGVNSGGGYVTGVISGTNTINFTASTNPFAGLAGDDYATCATAPVCPLILLPIELVSFEANCDDKTISLKWITASEKNNNYFAIEHSTDGIDFKQLTKIKGAGNSEELRTYSYTDTKPVSGINYYRLKQVDYDGTENYSELVDVNCVNNNESVYVFPNPATDELYIKVKKKQIDNIIVYDKFGQIVCSKTYNNDESSDLIYKLNIEHLAQGCYTIFITNKTTTFKVKFLK